MKSKTHKSVKGATGKPRSSPQALSGPPPAASAALVPSVSSSEQDNRASKASPEATGVPTEDPKKQYWYRPRNSKTRAMADKIAVMDAAGHPDAEIARRLKTAVSTIAQCRYIARKNGWWDVEDHPIDLDAEYALNIDRKVVRNISAALDGQMTNWQTHEMTIAAAKGRGHFRNHDAPQGQQTQLMPVAIQIVMPTIGADDQRMDIPDSMVGGRMAYVEGDVVTHDESTALTVP